MPATTSSAWRILLVDDDPLVCDSLRRMLEFDGHKVQLANSAQEALAACDNDSFDLVILDYIMPVMKGDALAVMLRKRFPDRPIIMITADAEKGSLTELPEGVDRIMSKPFELGELREAVRNMFPKV